MLLADKPVDIPQPPSAKPKAQRGAIPVYEALRDDILWLRLAPGSAIDEVALATRFEISRTPVREALMLLAAEHLVVFLPNRTSIVPPLSLHNLGHYMDMYLLLSRSAIRGAVMSYRPDDHAQPLRDALAAVTAGLAFEPAEPALRADLALRHLIGDIAGNWFQNKFYRQILDMGIRSRILHFFPNSRPTDLAAMQAAWGQAVEAICAGDADTADRVMTAMILTEGEVILRSHRPSYGHDLPLS
jgi:DNA-binding GntR family transcriptional regulator